MFNVDQILWDNGYDEWLGDMDTLTCPCGWTIEHDGQCPDGCVSPFILMGII